MPKSFMDDEVDQEIGLITKMSDLCIQLRDLYYNIDDGSIDKDRIKDYIHDRFPFINFENL